MCKFGKYSNDILKWHDANAFESTIIRMTNGDYIGMVFKDFDDESNGSFNRQKLFRSRSLSLS